MKMKIHTVSVAAAMILAGFNAGAADCSWTGGTIVWPSDGWTNDAYWSPSAPEAGDTAVFSVAVTALVDSATAPLVGSFTLVKAQYQYNTVLEIDSDSDVELGCQLGGVLTIVKNGGGKLTFTSDRRGGQAYGYYTDIAARALKINEGSVSTPSGAAAYCLPNALTVASGAKLLLAGTGNYLISKGLFGDGLVTNLTESVRTVQIGTTGAVDQGRFGGVIGGKIAVNVYCRQMFTGVANTYSGVTGVMYGSEDAATHGVFGFSKLGLLNDTATSVGASTYVDSQFGGRLLYLGEGETATKQLLLRTQDERSPIVDGGAHGGLVLAGEVRLHSDVPVYNKMAEVILDGSNAVPCVISGLYAVNRTSASSTPVTAYTTKKGSGVWRFSGNRDTVSGGFGIDEGTLQFDSIANAGTACSLGTATLLAQCYYGDWDDTKAESYAYRLGCETSTNAVFEFVGASSCAATDRPAVLAGDAHIRASGAENAALCFHGVSALSSGAAVKTLVLDGTNTADNVLAEVADGKGKLSLVKDGEGSWTLAGNQTFSGDLAVRGGMLTVKKNELYTWFKVTVKCVSDTSQGRMFLSEAAFYDRDGQNVSAGLAFVPGNVELVSGNNYTSSHRPSSLNPGQFTLADTSAARYLLRDGDWAFSNIFDGSLSAAWFAGTWNKVPDGEDAAYDFAFVARLDTEKPIVSFDLVQYAGDIYPTWITVEASTDGVNWVNVYENDEMVSRGGVWYSDRKSVSVPEPRLLADNAGLPLVSSSLADSFSTLANVASVSVSPGAVLRFVGDYVPAVSKLVVDGVSGAGTIRGFALDRDVTVDVLSPASGTVTVPLGFSGLSGFDSVTNWNFTVNGEDAQHHSFRIGPTGLRISEKKGLVIYFK